MDYKIIIDFNEYWSLILKNEQDYFSKMTDESFDLLKSALSNINNIITYNTTIKFVGKACNILDISDAQDQIGEYYKFMVIYNFDSNTEKAVDHYISHLPKQIVGKVKLYESGIELTRNLVYIVLI